MAIFEQILTTLRQYLTPGILLTMTSGSVIMMFASVLALPMILCRLPADYFDHEKPHLLERIRSASPVKAATLIMKNLVGIILLTAGLLMLFLPGQGMLTILIGLILIDFPGKYQIERRVVAKPKILHAINWLRQRHGRPDMIVTRY